MKKCFIIVLAIALILFSACGRIAKGERQKTNADIKQQQIAEASWAGWSIDQTIDSIPYVFLGRCLSLSDDSYSVQPQVEFKIEKVYQGKISEEKIIAKVISQDSFEEGESYLLFASAFASVFSGEDPNFLIEAVIGEKNTGVYAGSIAGLSFNSLAEVLNYVEEYTANHPYKGSTAVKGDYCRSSDLREIFDYSSNVFIAEITGVINNSASDRTSYSFRVIDEIKGSVKDEQYVIAFKDSMQVGGKYLLLLQKPDETSIFFVVDSLYSIFPANSEGAATVLSFK